MLKKVIQKIIGWGEYALKLFLHHKFVVSWKKILISYIAFGIAVFGGFSFLRVGWSTSDKYVGPVLEFHMGNWDYMIFIAFLLYLVILGYILYVAHKGEIREFQLKEIQLKSANIEQIGGNEVIRDMIPAIKESLDNLKVKDAYRLFNKLRENACAQVRLDYGLLSLIDLYRSQCSKYFAPEESRKCARLSVNEMRKAFIYVEEILANEEYHLLKEGNVDNAIVISHEIMERNDSSIWAYLPLLVVSEDLTVSIQELPLTIRSNNLLYANLILVKQDVDLQKVLPLDNYEIEEPCKFNLTNLPLWMFNISVVLDQHLKKEGYDLLGNMPVGKYVFRLQEITRKYLSFEKSTELVGLCPDVIYLNAYAEYLITKEPQWIEVAKTSKVSARNKQHYWLFLSTMLNGAHRYSESLDILCLYDNKDEYVPVISTFILVTALQCDDIPRMQRAFTLAVDADIYLDDRSLHYYYTALHYNKEYLGDLAVKLKCSNPSSQIVFSQLVQKELGHKLNPDLILENIDKVADGIKCYAAYELASCGHYEYSLDFLRKRIQIGIINADMAAYIQLLKQKKENSCELYSVLQSLSKNGFTQELQFLQDEYSLACNCYDYVNAVRVAKIIYEKDKNNPKNLFQYISVLNMLDEKPDINALLDIAREIDWDDNLIEPVIHAFIVNYRDKEALDIIYAYTYKSDQQYAKDLYFQVVEFNGRIHQIVYEEPGFITSGLYIEYEENGQKKNTIITSDGAFSALVNKSTGEHIIYNFGVARNIKVLRIYNKYAERMREILRETHDNQNSRAIQSVVFGETITPDELLSFIDKTLGVTEEKKNHREDMNNQYQHGNVSLMYYWCGDNRALPKLYDIIFGDFQLVSYPSGYLAQLLKQRNVEIRDWDLVLDITSLVLLFELQHIVSFDIKGTIYVTEATYQGIRREIMEEIHHIPAGLTQKVHEKLVWGERSQAMSFLHYRFSEMKKWIDNNCTVVLVKERLNIDFSEEKNIWHDAATESVCFCRNRRTILVTEDVAMVKRLVNLCPVLNIESLCEYYLGDTALNKAKEFLLGLNK